MQVSQTDGYYKELSIVFIAKIQALVQLHSPVSFMNGSISQMSKTKAQRSKELLDATRMYS